MSNPRRQSSADTAASFLKSYERRRQRQIELKRARELTVPAVPDPRPRLKPQRKRPAGEPRSTSRVARPDKIGPDTLFVLVSVPIATYQELIDHCAEYGITPQTFVKQMLQQAKLSRSGT